MSELFLHTVRSTNFVGQPLRIYEDVVGDAHAKFFEGQMSYMVAQQKFPSGDGLTINLYP